MPPRGQLITIAPLEWWKNLAPNRKIQSWHRLAWADAIICAARKKGAIDPEHKKMYGLGAMTSTYGEIMYNVGDHLLVENKESGLMLDRRPLRLEGENEEEIYLPGPAVNLKDHPKAGLWAREFAEAVMGYRWETKEDGQAFLGWCVTSLVGGALPVRPMLWILGNAGSGKSFVLSNMLNPLMGALLSDTASASEAGLAAVSEYSSLPCYLDEFEPDKRNEDRMRSIMDLMRLAFSGGAARLRGTATGGIVIKRPRFSLLTSSINKPVLDTASESRIVYTHVSRFGVKDWPAVRDGIAKSLTKTRAIAIRTYIIRHTAIIARRAKEIEAQLDGQGIDARTAQIKASLTAGYNLLSGKELSAGKIEARQEDDLGPLEILMSAMLRIDGKTEITLAECLRAAYFNGAGHFYPPGEENAMKMAEIASRYGMEFRSEDELWVGRNVPTLRNLLRNSPRARTSTWMSTSCACQG